MSKHFRFYIDENLSPNIAKPLGNIFTRHRFSTPSEANLIGLTDMALFRELGQRDFDAIITADTQQTVVQQEREELRSNGLHWVHLDQPTVSGIDSIAYQLATTVSGLPYVFKSWQDEPTAYFLRSANLRGPRREPL